jgi:branched-chain amino acid transport system substrate-binding protein
MLGKKVETFTLDTKTEPPVAVAAVRKAVESKPFAIVGPIYSGSALACMGVARDAGIPQFVGSESASIIRQNNPIRELGHDGRGVVDQHGECQATGRDVCEQ